MERQLHVLQESAGPPVKVSSTTEDVNLNLTCVFETIILSHSMKENWEWNCRGWGKSSTLRNGMFLFAVKATAKIKYKSIE